jgi:hypothetical protein
MAGLAEWGTERLQYLKLMLIRVDRGSDSVSGAIDED